MVLPQFVKVVLDVNGNCWVGIGGLTRLGVIAAGLRQSHLAVSPCRKDCKILANYSVTACLKGTLFSIRKDSK